MRSETRAAVCRLAAAALAALSWPATGGLVPYGSAQIERYSNIFFRSEQQPSAPDASAGTGTVLDLILPPADAAASGGNGDPAPSDTVLRYIAGIEANLLLGNQKLRAVGEGRRYRYSRFQHLDHPEHLLGAGLDWRLTESDLDGTLDYRQERRMAAFADRNSTALALEDERTGAATANLDFGADWRLETGLKTRELESPLPGFPDFTLKENSFNAALEHLIAETLAIGVYTEYLSGRFEGVAGARSFDQQSLAATADYAVTDLGAIGAQLGYTRRHDQGGGGLSALTGLLRYQRDLTAKTIINLQAFSRVRSYAAGASAVREFGADAALSWQPTLKILVAGGLHWTQGRFQDSASVGSGRKDESLAASAALTYQMRPWLALRPTVRYEERDSTSEPDSFESTITGFEVQARFQ